MLHAERSRGAYIEIRQDLPACMADFSLVRCRLNIVLVVENKP